MPAVYAETSAVLAWLLGEPRAAEVMSVLEPLSPAWAQVTDGLDAPAAWIPGATDRHREVRSTLLRTSELRANHVPDAYLAALAIAHGMILCSTDDDFGRFSGLRWENPLAAG